MAYTDRQIIDFLFKKLGYVLAKTGGEAYTSATSTTFGTAKAPTSESIGSPLVVPASSVWANSANIPTTPPAADTADVKVYLSSSPLQLSKDTSVASQRTWLACTTLDNLTTRIGDWIDPGNFGSTYLIKIYKGPLLSGSVQAANQLFPQGSGNNDSWFFDYSNGVLNFGDTTNPVGVSDTLYLVGYRYIGTKGVGGGGGGSITVQDEGTNLTTSATSLNFVGAGVQATNAGNAVTVTVSGGGGGSALEIRDEGINIGAATTAINFVGTGVQATYGSGIATVTVSGGGGSALEIRDEGTSIGAAATVLNFVGTGVQATYGSGITTVTVSGGGGSALEIRDEGINIGAAATVLNFVGTGVQATYGSGITTVTVSSSGSIPGINTTGTSFFNHLDISGVGTFFSGNFRIRNVSAFGYTFNCSTLTADRIITLPSLTADDTVAFLGQPQTFTANQNFNVLTGVGTFSWNVPAGASFQVNTSSFQGAIILGANNGIATITLGQSTASQITNIQAAATSSGNTKTINLGTGGLTGSNTQITIGSTFAGTITLNNNVNALGIITATTFSGSHTGTFSGDGSGLTGIVASGTGIIIRDDGSLVGTASSIDFGTNLSVSPVSAGIVTVTGSGGGVSNSTAIAYAIALS